MKRPLRFGIQTAPQHVTFEEMRACWQTAERAGFDIAYVFDHFIPIYSDENGPCMECFTTLTAQASATERMRISTLVVGAGYRHPAVLANICATLDVISGGRFELGIGAGWWEREYRACPRKEHRFMAHPVVHFENPRTRRGEAQPVLRRAPRVEDR